MTRRGRVAALSLVAAAGGIALAVHLATPGLPAMDEEKLRRARMMEELMAALGPSAARVQAIYVTVDPERDRGAHLGSYLRAFDDRILGLTGSVEEIAAVAERYKAYFAKVPLGQTYVMEHSANFYVLDQDGRFAGSLPPGTSWHRLADVIRERLG